MRKLGWPVVVEPPCSTPYIVAKKKDGRALGRETR